MCKVIVDFKRFSLHCVESKADTQTHGHRHRVSKKTWDYVVYSCKGKSFDFLLIAASDDKRKFSIFRKLDVGWK